MIKNTTRKTVIAKNYKILDSKLSQALGLMFSKPKCLVFDFKKEKRISLHMLFVFFPIDVLFLDNGKKVVEVKENFRPFTFYTSKSDKIRYVIELPKATVKGSKTRLYDKIEF